MRELPYASEIYSPVLTSHRFTDLTSGTKLLQFCLFFLILASLESQSEDSLHVQLSIIFVTCKNNCNKLMDITYHNSPWKFRQHMWITVSSNFTAFSTF